VRKEAGITFLQDATQTEEKYYLETMGHGSRLARLRPRWPHDDELVEFVTGRLKKKGELKVCAFGGGPRTELLALTKFLIDNRKKIADCEISFVLLDEVEEWVESWNLIEGEVRNCLKKKLHRAFIDL
jgi:hypothetical protein